MGSFWAVTTTWGVLVTFREQGPNMLGGPRYAEQSRTVENFPKILTSFKCPPDENSQQI